PAYCTQGDPATSASRTPSQRGGGSGARQRNAPTGAAAYGMPSHVALPYRPTKPTISPLVVVRRSDWSAAGRSVARDPHAATSASDKRTGGRTRMRGRRSAPASSRDRGRLFRLDRRRLLLGLCLAAAAQALHDVERDRDDRDLGDQDVRGRWRGRRGRAATRWTERTGKEEAHHQRRPRRG